MVAGGPTVMVVQHADGQGQAPPRARSGEFRGEAVTPSSIAGRMAVIAAIRSCDAGMDRRQPQFAFGKVIEVAGVMWPSLAPGRG
jgi:hypothetical protein